MTFETLPTIPDIKLDEQQYRIIEQMVKERRYFLLEFDIRNHFRLGPVNTITLLELSVVQNIPMSMLCLVVT